MAQTANPSSSFSDLNGHQKDASKPLAPSRTPPGTFTPLAIVARPSMYPEHDGLTRYDSIRRIPQPQNLA